MHVQDKRDFDESSTRCMRGKSVLSRHPVYTMYMRGAAAQGWSAEGLTVTQWIIGHNSSGSEAGAWFSLTLSLPLSLASLDGPSCNSIPAAAVTRWRRLWYPGLARDETYCCYACSVGHALYERGSRRKHVQADASAYTNVFCVRTLFCKYRILHTSGVSNFSAIVGAVYR